MAHLRGHVVRLDAWSRAAAARRVVNPAAAAGSLGGIVRPYSARTVPPAIFANSARIDALTRAGKLYLSLQDAIALALENNLDIELKRCGPRIAQTDVEGAESGGAIRGVLDRE